MITNADTFAPEDDVVSSIFGAADTRDDFPASESRCLAGLAQDGNRIYVADTCVGFLVALDLVEVTTSPGR